MFKIISAGAAIVLVIAAVIIFGANSSTEVTAEPPVEIAPAHFTAEPATEPPEETPEKVDPYTHVRFGDTRNILLLDLEWHTPESYAEEVEIFKKESEDRRNSQQDEWNDWREEHLKYMEECLIDIKDKKLYIARTANGKEIGYFTISDDEPFDIYESEVYTEYGYYAFKIYPYPLVMLYADENGEWQYKDFGNMGSKSQYDYVLKHEVIPFCDELLEKDLITQDFYDGFIIEDLLDYYTNLYFGTGDE